MANADLGTIAERLFHGFMAPLVLGGAMHPAKPIGGKIALALGEQRSLADIDEYAHVQLARIRCARQIVPVDTLDEPSVEEWALTTCLHDLVQTTHPDLGGVFRGGVSNKLLSIVESTLERIPSPYSAGDALSRHTWFSRIFEIARTDTTVKSWVGSRTFLGTTPPERLTAWPKLRRVHIDKTPRVLVELAGADAKTNVVDREHFDCVLATFLTKTPLTDLATAARASPAFTWSGATLSLVGSRSGRTLAVRALRRIAGGFPWHALGRAMRPLLAVAERRVAEPALGLLGELLLEDPEPSLGLDGEAAFARKVGAAAALEQLTALASCYAPAEHAELIAKLTPMAKSAT